MFSKMTMQITIVLGPSSHSSASGGSGAGLRLAPALCSVLPGARPSVFLSAGSFLPATLRSGLGRCFTSLGRGWASFGRGWASFGRGCSALASARGAGFSSGSRGGTGVPP